MIWQKSASELQLCVAWQEGPRDPPFLVKGLDLRQGLHVLADADQLLEILSVVRVELLEIVGCLCDLEVDQGQVA